MGSMQYGILLFVEPEHCYRGSSSSPTKAPSQVVQPGPERVVEKDAGTESYHVRRARAATISSDGSIIHNKDDRVPQ
jgi:hypothetical protein